MNAVARQMAVVTGAIKSILAPLEKAYRVSGLAQAVSLKADSHLRCGCPHYLNVQAGNGRMLAVESPTLRQPCI